MIQTESMLDVADNSGALDGATPAKAAVGADGESPTTSTLGDRRGAGRCC